MIKMIGERKPVRTDEEYLSFDLFSGEEGELSLRHVEIRTARKQHQCFGHDGTLSHAIEPGQRYRHEKALVDGSFFGQYRVCLSCLDKMISKFEGDDVE